MLEDMHEGGVYRRVEVITDRRHRRNWSREEKTRIVAESLDRSALSTGAPEIAMCGGRTTNNQSETWGQ